MTLKIPGLRALRSCPFFPLLRRGNLARSGALALVGLGSNIPPEAARFSALIRRMMDDPRLALIATSPLLINEAFGLAGRDFTNAVLLLRTRLGAGALLRILLFYEFKFRRVRTVKNAPRKLDLDLLYFSGRAWRGAHCQLPHPGAASRPSVFIPLALIA